MLSFNFFLRLLYYSIYDLKKFFINLSSKYNFLIIYPRILSLLIKKVLIYDKKNHSFFSHYIRNYSDILTVYEIFSEENYNLKNLKVFNNIQNSLIKKKDLKKNLIIDCGSNIGASSIYFSRLYENSLIVLIEPDIDNFLISKKNAVGENYFYYNNAISNQAAKVGFFKDNLDNRASHVSEENSNKIECLTVDMILNKFKESDYSRFIIKIDIEGYEDKLFESNFYWIDKFKVIIIEIHDWMLPNKSNSKKFLDALSQVMNKYRRRDLIICE